MQRSVRVRRGVAIVWLALAVAMPVGAASAAHGAASAEPPTVLPIPDDFYFSDQWGLFNYGQDVADGRLAGTAGADLHVPEAWTITTGSPEVVVAVVDTGTSYDHPDLAPNIWTNDGETGLDATGGDRRSNGVDDDGNGYVDDWRGWDFVDDDNDPRGPIAGAAEVGAPLQHGTAVAGVIGAVADNGVGIAGVAPRTKLMILRAGTDGGRPGFGSARSAKALAYATQMGARVVNLSYGGPPVFNDGADERAVMDAHPEVLFVAAAGNSGNSVDKTGFTPCTHGLENLLCVAASDPDDGLARWPAEVAEAGDEGSNWGEEVHVAAPGVGIITTAPAQRVVASFGFDDGLAAWNTPAGSAPWRVVDGAGRDGGAALTPPSPPTPAGDSLRMVASPDLSEYADCYLSVWVDTTRSVPREGSLQVRRATRRDGRYLYGAGGLQVSTTNNGMGWTRHVVHLPDSSDGSAWWELFFDTGSAGVPPGMLIDDVEISCSTEDYGPDAYTYTYGTSFATPMVSGVAALAAAVAPTFDGAALRSVIIDGADPSPGLDTIAGGRVNAWRTVVLAGERARAGSTPTTPVGNSPSTSSPGSETTAARRGRALEWPLRAVYRQAPNTRTAGADTDAAVTGDPSDVLPADSPIRKARQRGVPWGLIALATLGVAGVLVARALAPDPRDPLTWLPFTKAAKLARAAKRYRFPAGKKPRLMGRTKAQAHAAQAEPAPPRDPDGGEVIPGSDRDGLPAHPRDPFKFAPDRMPRTVEGTKAQTAAAKANPGARERLLDYEVPGGTDREARDFFEHLTGHRPENLPADPTVRGGAGVRFETPDGRTIIYGPSTGNPAHSKVEIHYTKLKKTSFKTTQVKLTFSGPPD
ncbi:MAG: S8 family serine peptidase [Acidimicrobiia bacterium]